MKLTGIKTLLLLSLLVTLISCSSSEPEPADSGIVTPQTALKSYLDKEDSAFSWNVEDFESGGSFSVFNLLFTSQQWREHTWRHQLTVILPETVEYNDALLFITGGKLGEDGLPEWADPEDELLEALKKIAQANSAVVAILRQTPNQPLYDDLYEDALISYTLHQYRQSRDFTWPLLFPMTKSAVKAMDVVQEFCLEKKNAPISGFVVSGASKRGWTTWLTGAFDPRVRAICPMVIDVLNMPVQMDYHVTAWGAYSEEIQDYVNLGIAQDVSTPDGQELVAMIDPFSYRERLTMPKMIFLGTNDAYWPVDAVKNYLDDIPGENYLHYVPDAGHDLNGGGQALQALSAFFGQTLQDLDYADCNWSISVDDKKAAILVDTEDDGSLITAKLWTAASDDRDFRDEKWINTDLQCKGAPDLKASISLPLKGFRAFYIELLYTSPSGNPYSLSTRMFVMDTSGVL